MGFEIKEMADREYFADPALDQSALKRFMVSPLSYVDYLDHGLDVSGDALDFGKARMRWCGGRRQAESAHEGG